MTYSKYSPYLFVFSAVLLVLLVTLVPINFYISLSLAFIFLILSVLILKKSTVKFDHLVIPVLASTAFTHSVTISGLNVSISDLYISIMLIALLFLQKFRIDIPFNFLVIVMLYIGYSFISLYWTLEPAKSIPRLIQYLEFMIISVLVFYNINKIELQKLVLKFFISLSTTLSLIGIYIYFSQNLSEPLYIMGFHKNALGWVLGGAIPIIFGFILLSKKTTLKSFYFVCLLINMLALIMTMSRGAILGSILGVCVLLFFANRMRLLITISLFFIAIGGVFVTLIAPEYLERALSFDYNSSAYSRVLLYEHARMYIDMKPYFGHGLGNYYVYLPNINFSQDDPNNVILLNLIEGGIVGLFFFLLIILYVFKAAFKNKKLFKHNYELLVLNGVLFGAFIGRLAHIQVDVTWVRGSGLFMFAVVGMLLALKTIHKKTSE